MKNVDFGFCISRPFISRHFSLSCYNIQIRKRGDQKLDDHFKIRLAVSFAKCRWGLFSPCQKSRPRSVRSNLAVWAWHSNQRGFRRLFRTQTREATWPLFAPWYGQGSGAHPTGHRRLWADPHLRRLWCGRDDIGLHYEGNLGADGCRGASLPTQPLHRRLWSQWECLQLLYRAARHFPDCHGGQWGRGQSSHCHGPGHGSWCYRDGSPLYARGFTGCICDHSSGASRCGLSLPLSSRMWCGL